MTDRELLELSAKAAGYIVLRYVNDYADEYGKAPDYGLQIEGYYCIWNPLEDDGDAFRLAVKLRINVTHGANMVNAEREQPEEVAAVEPFNGDPAAATRRAIVKAAAEIGSRW